MDKLYTFQSRFVKTDKFGWCGLERIPADAGTQFTPTEFQDECQIRGVHMTLAAPEHQETGGQVKVTIAHSRMVHVRLLEAYIHFTLIYTTDHFLPVLPIHYLMKKTARQPLHLNVAIDTKPLIYHFHFFHVLYKNIMHVLGQRS